MRTLALFVSIWWLVSSEPICREDLTCDSQKEHNYDNCRDWMNGKLGHYILANAFMKKKNKKKLTNKKRTIDD